MHGDFESASECGTVYRGDGREGKAAETGEDAGSVCEVLGELLVVPLSDALEIGPGDEDALACGGEDEPGAVPRNEVQRVVEALNEVLIEDDNGFIRLFEYDSDSTWA